MSSDHEILLDVLADHDAQPWPDDEPLKFARGMLFALPLGGLLWVGIYFAVRALW